MTYKNSRLKHVKKIVKLCDEAKAVLGKNTIPTIKEAIKIIDGQNILMDKLLTISDQCNLLLETKKKKRCENCEMKPGKVIRVDDIYAKDMKCADCGKKLKSFEVIQDTKPSPQPEIEKLDCINTIVGGVDMPTLKNASKIVDKINEVIEQLNKLTKTK